MPREISAGGVVLRQMEGRWWIAVIEPESSSGNAASEERRTLALPKGNLDQDERPEVTALREVHEETGIQAELVCKLTDIRYVYVRSWGDGQRVFKIVSFYLLRYLAGQIGEIAPEMRIEVRHAEWIPLEEAHRRLSYRGERDVVRLAQEYVAAHPDLALANRPSTHSGRRPDASGRED